MKWKAEASLWLVLAIGAAPALLAADLSYGFPQRGRFILPSSAAHEIFKQCSRSAPSASSQTWIPTEKDIEELESLLPKYLEQHQGGGNRVPPKGPYHRQYMGFIKHGERYIYGNFYPPDPREAPFESKRAIQVCDGGPGFWGIVYRVKTKTFENIQFNGVA